MSQSPQDHVQNPVPSSLPDDVEAALQRSSGEMELRDAAAAISAVSEDGERVREIALSRPAAGPMPVAVTNRRVFVDARRVDGSLHWLPSQAVTGLRLEPMPDGTVSLVLGSLGEEIQLVGLTETAARRLHWALDLEFRYGKAASIDIAARFNAWVDVVGDDDLDDDERAE